MRSAVKFFAAALLFLTILPFAWAQGGAPPIPNTLGYSAGTGWISVYLRDTDGMAVSSSKLPQMTLTSLQGDTLVPQMPRFIGTAWVFSGLANGVTYSLEIKVDGYQPAHETVDIPGSDYGTVNVYVYLKPIDERLTFHPPTGQFLLAPRVQKEVQQGLKDLQSGKIPSAQKHLQKAVQMSPGNPYVNYAMGMCYLIAKQPASAQPYLEESVSLDPSQAASLLALGTVRFDEANYAGAIDVLNKAVKLDASSWKAEWLLASAYLNHRDYRQACDYARKALTSGREKADPVRLVLVQALAGMGDRDAAEKALSSFLSDHPNDPNALKVRAWLMSLPKSSAIHD